jgi:hypothetical protein
MPAGVYRTARPPGTSGSSGASGASGTSGADGARRTGFTVRVYG